jgi:hypothetical protein
LPSRIPASARANVITDWDENAVAVVTPPVLALHPERQRRSRRQGGAGRRDIPEVALTSPATPGVLHRWTNMAAFTEEVANARIWAGFHHRFSTHVGADMGLQIGEYVVKTVMQPVTSSR